ncbi:MAG TPA: Zn-dependent hydrolase [Microscillaceae bacterium]|nr:Zn-dependent hydrolase [Microscillaceae bacterium]
MKKSLTINASRLHQRIQDMGKIGALPGGGVCRLALSKEDQTARDLFKQWCQDLHLKVLIDAVGNMLGVQEGSQPELPMVVTGSHLDSVATGGLFDGPLGVLAGLEALQTLQENGYDFKRSLAIANFTNEEGARFTPDMMGSLYIKKGISQQEIYAAQSIQAPHVSFESALQRIGYQGKNKLQDLPFHSFVELHIEQGPILEQENITIGVVEKVQGIYWTEFHLKGVANHAGTTPMHLRHDAGYVAAEIATLARKISQQFAGQVATVGMMQFSPNLINVVPQEVVFTVDLRNTNHDLLEQAYQSLITQAQELANKEGVTLVAKSLVQFAPVDFDAGIIDKVEHNAQNLGYTTRRMPSGAGHDAQMMAAICPTSMIFVPSVAGISHNVKEFTHPAHIEAGTNVLLGVIQELLEE